jgi:solute:Na+ symporter, SSS family
MNAVNISLIISFYFLILLVIAYFTGRNANNAGFFVGNRKSPWYVVSFGMIGASLSGVTFISIPGWVGESHFSYLQMVIGYLAGYFVIANVLMPLYYRLELTSIYTYLDTRFGKSSYKTGAWFFLLSRTIGASFRLFLVANVLQITIFNSWNVPFYITVLVTIAFIWLFTFKGGIKTIIWTDTIQTFAMLTALILCIVLISKSMGMNVKELFRTLSASEYSRIFYWDDWKSPYHFVKQFLGGAFIAIVMTGLDQDMMQKNLSCKNIREAKKNMYWFSLALVPVNILFLILGALLFIYSSFAGITIPKNTDDLFPMIATGGYLTPVLAFFFIIGLISAAYSSADSALTSLTTSFTIDILGGKKYKERELKQTRHIVHIAMSLVLGVFIILFHFINDQNVVKAIFTIAGYTYGPILGLYAFGMFTKKAVKDRFVPLIAIVSPLLCLFINNYSREILWGYKFGFELLILNGLITFLGLWMISRKTEA